MILWFNGQTGTYTITLHSDSCTKVSPRQLHHRGIFGDIREALQLVGLKANLDATFDETDSRGYGTRLPDVALYRQRCFAVGGIGHPMGDDSRLERDDGPTVREGFLDFRVDINGGVFLQRG